MPKLAHQALQSHALFTQAATLIRGLPGHFAGPSRDAAHSFDMTVHTGQDLNLAHRNLTSLDLLCDSSIHIHGQANTVTLKDSIYSQAPALYA